MKDKINFKFNNGKLRVGDKAILSVNKKKYMEENFYNGTMFIVKTIEDGIVNDLFNINDVEANYAMTGNRAQGRTINDPFNIHEINKMSLNAIYTNISRARRLSDIHLDVSKIKNIYKYSFGKIILREYKNEIKHGNIYEVFDEETDTYYIGMTYNEIEKRLNEEINDCKSAIYGRMKPPVIRLIGNVHGSDSMVRKYEKNYTILYKTLYGDNCLNQTNFKEKIFEMYYNDVIETEMRAFIHEEKNDHRFRITWKDYGKTNIKKFNYNKKGRDVVLDEIKNWCVENFDGYIIRF